MRHILCSVFLTQAGLNEVVFVRASLNTLPVSRHYNRLSGYTMTAIDTEITPVKRMFDVNLFGPIQMVHHFHGMIIQAQGTIVNIGSIGGVVPYLYGCQCCHHENIEASS